MDSNSNVVKNPSLSLRLIDKPSDHIHLTRQLTVSKSGRYSFQISSQFSTKVYLYSNNFNASYPSLNLMVQSQSDSNGQVQFTTFLQGGNGLSRKVRIVPFRHE